MDLTIKLTFLLYRKYSARNTSPSAFSDFTLRTLRVYFLSSYLISSSQSLLAYTADENTGNTPISNGQLPRLCSSSVPATKG